MPLIREVGALVGTDQIDREQRQRREDKRRISRLVEFRGPMRVFPPARSDHSHVWRRYRLLLLGSDRPKSLSLRNPRRSVSVGQEAVCFLHKFAKACDPDFVSVPVLEYLVYCVVHRRGSFWHGREGQGSHGATTPPYHNRAPQTVRWKNTSFNSGWPVRCWCPCSVCELASDNPVYRAHSADGRA
jgi:hypothetical protein